MSATINRRHLVTESPTGRRWETRLVLPPDQIPHYSHNPHLPVFFYGGWASSFAPYWFQARMLFDSQDPGDVPRYPTRWETREHWFQAHKTFDLRAVVAIAEKQDPWVAKSLGNSRNAFTFREDWDEGPSYETMLEGIRIQLDRYEALRELLRATGDRFIAEVSRQGDVIWGIHDPVSNEWNGKNWLGAAWMEAREEI